MPRKYGKKHHNNASHKRNNQRHPVDLNTPVLTLYFFPLDHPMTHYSIYKYFRQFGDVDLVKLHDVQDLFSKAPKYGFVQFKDTAAALLALSQPEHEIDGLKIKVNAAHRKHQPQQLTLNAQPLSTGYEAPGSDSLSNILNALNDVCLRKIFWYLTAKDLCATANVCVRFNANAKQVFAVEYDVLDFEDVVVEENLTFCELESLLCTFNKEIKSVNVEGQYKETIVFLSMLSEHCKNVKEIELTALNLDKQEFEILRPLLKHLESLRMFDNMCWPPSPTNFINEASNLKIFEYEGLPNHFRFPEKTLHKLHELKLNGIGNATVSSLNRFFELNPSLEKVHILSGDPIDTSRILRTISDALTNLKELVFSTYKSKQFTIEKDLLLLAKLPSLTKLDLSFHQLSIAPLMKALQKTPIQSLKIVEGLIDDAGVENLSKLVGITSMEFIRCRDLQNGHLIKMAKNLPNLSTLSIMDAKQITTSAIKEMVKHSTKMSFIFLQRVRKVIIGSNDYKEILKMVKNQTKLTIEIYGSGGQVKVSDAVLSDWLIIEEN
ncbi:uncharacterized protein LOC116342951 [Contarinia nasturtii]|uniref:uncharacterized protein LOC116342951 n=1 Tax=Contarinia nasturtii TaxID=265458 RepID=UPI0012D3AFA8|nr:uncharacterized protein LOC116342951 [Contarinia nasturtii]